MPHRGGRHGRLHLLRLRLSELRAARPDSAPLKEGTVFPADPDMEYGWEKLTTEILCGTFRRTYGMDIKIARLHAVYGPLGAYSGPRAKSLSALCGRWPPYRAVRARSRCGATAPRPGPTATSTTASPACCDSRGPRRTNR
ncbi:NAD-dependent epimerase/dehydratase family protein [Streptomyces sp. M19]